VLSWFLGWLTTASSDGKAHGVIRPDKNKQQQRWLNYSYQRLSRFVRLPVRKLRTTIAKLKQLDLIIAEPKRKRTGYAHHAQFAKAPTMHYAVNWQRLEAELERVSLLEAERKDKDFERKLRRDQQRAKPRAKYSHVGKHKIADFPQRRFYHL